MTMTGQRLESIQVTKVAMKVQLRTERRSSRAALGSGKNDAVSVLEVRENILRQTNGTASFTVMNF